MVFTIIYYLATHPSSSLLPSTTSPPHKLWCLQVFHWFCFIASHLLLYLINTFNIIIIISIVNSSSTHTSIISIIVIMTIELIYDLAPLPRLLADRLYNSSQHTLLESNKLHQTHLFYLLSQFKHTMMIVMLQLINELKIIILAWEITY